MTGISNPDARLALSQIPNLKGLQAHTSCMLSDIDVKTFKKLGIDLTSEPIRKR